jgi:hypothetical protein
MKNTMKEVTIVNKKKIIKVKEICASYFKNYEESLKMLKNKFIVVHDAFEAWNQNVLKPNELKEATLFSMECRLKEIEKSRYIEMESIKDVINKLIYTLEQ